jgi:hypothetical protein
MRMIGFSTGSIAPGDVPLALRMLRDAGVQAVELSALRIAELPVLLESAGTLSLDGFKHVSVHAPSKFDPSQEEWVVRLLKELTGRGWPIVVHPDVVREESLWRELGPFLWIENMDKRKPIGRTARELAQVFRRLPEAGLCLDLAHARQCDPSMMETHRILRMHGERLQQVHLSEVSSASKHTPLSYGAIHDFCGVSDQIPNTVPVILESPVAAQEIRTELERALEALPVRALAAA